MKKYEILDHKADLKIRIFGKNKKTLFLNALCSLREALQVKVKKPEKKTKREIKIKSLDFPALLVDFLSEVLYLSQTYKEVYSLVEFKTFSEKEIKGELIGQKAETFDREIKAATYHNLEVWQEKNKTWTAIIIFDI